MRVYRNDAITVDELAAMAPECIVLSPGPGRPCNAGICIEIVKTLAPQIPILGVCLGHQVIVEAFGGEVIEAPNVVHGKATQIRCNGEGLFSDIDTPMVVGRYHSLCACPDSIPECLEVTATTEEGELMAVCHRQYPCYGVQFHPESILTPNGFAILRNFLAAHEKI